MPEVRVSQDLEIPKLPREKKETIWLSFARQSNEGDCKLPFLYIAGESEGPTLVVLAGVHGDEYEGILTIPRLFQQISPEDLQGTLLMIPICNMPAYETATRNSPMDGLNLARVFPGNSEGTITQRIASGLTQNLFTHADFLIDLHSGGMTYNIPTLVGYYHSDNPLGQTSLEGAKVFGAPTLWGHPVLASGRTISTATDLGVPWLYTEAPGGGFTRPEDVTCFLEGICNVMKVL